MAKNTKLKALQRSEKRDTRPSAEAKYIRMTPDKVRVVLDVVRGKSVNEAIALLDNIPKAACEPVSKLIKSAVANAVDRFNYDPADLFVAVIYAGDGPTLKRIRPKDHGRAHRILKRTSHIKVILDTVKEGR